MMIAFWSGCRNCGCVTSNLVLMGVLGALLLDRKGLIWEAHCHLNHAETMLTGWRCRDEMRERNLYEGQKGLDCLIRYCHTGRQIHNLCLERSEWILEERLAYLARSSQTPQMLDYTLSQVLSRLLRCMEEEFPVLWIDTGCGQSMAANEILDRADLVVINLPQDPAAVHRILSCSMGLREKAVYLFGNYYRHSRYTYRSLAKGYGIPAARCGYIPHNREFQDACISGRVVPFLTDRLRAGPQDSAYLFLRGARMAVHMIERQIRRWETERLPEKKKNRNYCSGSSGSISIKI